MDPILAQLRGQFTLRRYQQLALDASLVKLNGRLSQPIPPVPQTTAERPPPPWQSLHIVAPPGSGKTILGLEMIARRGRPALILSPNTAIQAQWADKARHFLPVDGRLQLNHLVSTDPQQLRPITSLTYQALSTAHNDTELLDELARVEWLLSLETNNGLTEEEAESRLAQMAAANPNAYREELARHRVRVRQIFVKDDQYDIGQLLHRNARRLCHRLVEHGVGTVILDECHHLTGYWARIVDYLVRQLPQPLVVGLTATPPLDAADRELTRYLDIVGPITFEVPTPAVVKEGNLAPYQDLVYFTYPTPTEMQFVDEQHELFKRLVHDLMHNQQPINNPKAEQAAAAKQQGRDSDFLRWVNYQINHRSLTGDRKQAWKTFVERRRPLAVAGVRLLRQERIRLADDVVVTPEMKLPLELEDWAVLLEDYALRRLKLSPNKAHHAWYDQIRAATRALGLLLTETGFRRQAAAVDRVIALSQAKMEAIGPILQAEEAALGQQLRAVILTDFETSNATSLRQLEGILDEESGGAVGVLRLMVNRPELDALEPVMVTGTAVLCDDDVAARFLREGQAWLDKQGIAVQLRDEKVEGAGFHRILGSGSLWGSRTYVLLVTHLFEQGVTRCLIGTRGLLGEGWDSLALNTLIDLTTATTYMTVNQLRGRSLRLDPNQPVKVADNWDVVCVAPGYEKGLNDYRRFVRKHSGFYGLCDDGEIESGVGHVHPSLTDTQPEAIEEQMAAMNADMLARPARRREVYALWQIGQPFANEEVPAVELQIKGSMGQRPFNTLPRQSLFGNIHAAMNLAGRPSSAADHVRAMATAVLLALQQAQKVSRALKPEDVVIHGRSGGFLRVYVKNGTNAEAQLIIQSIDELFMPITDQRYIIPRQQVQPAQRGMAQAVLFLKSLLGIALDDKIETVWHPLPATLAASRTHADIFSKHWQRHVSPGRAIFARRGEGKEQVEVERGRDPLEVNRHRKSIWR
jgi:superfamily II DNA or RNA helicase